MLYTYGGNSCRPSHVPLPAAFHWLAPAVRHWPALAVRHWPAPADLPSSVTGHLSHVGLVPMSPNTLLRSLRGRAGSRRERIQACSIIFSPFGVILSAVHKTRPLDSKQFPLQRLTLTIRPHDVRRTVLHFYLAAVYLILDKEEFGFDVLCFLGARKLTIHLQHLRTDVVLVEFNIVHLITLFSHKVQRPQHFWHVHIRCN